LNWIVFINEIFKKVLWVLNDTCTLLSLLCFEFGSFVCYFKWYWKFKKIPSLLCCLVTGIQAGLATYIPLWSVHPCYLIMVCTVSYSVCTYFEIFPQNDEWFSPSYTDQYMPCYLNFVCTVQWVHILKFSFKVMNGLDQIC
jgi:hypothetical protein